MSVSLIWIKDKSERAGYHYNWGDSKTDRKLGRAVKKVAMTVLSDREDASLSPFFARARWIALFDGPSGSIQFIRNRDASAAFVVEQICRAAPSVAICGHIDHESAQRFVDAGIDLRIGPCSVPAVSLLGQVDELPPYSLDGAPSNLA
ncbi:MAG: hypothetical protein QF827_03830 [Alphaproteobacteria bacterium]|jgi:predicted Fe-Mo cluster-binding NifX family protein|nr:hypothetical protein [Alphaproteobacteria bacterium]|tara:strand:+ start:764 stop:1207 length:444 start_codon:yes stop_codon:yes gene_type:complete